jgi:ubiquinone biosynthesis protein COQ4
MPFVQLSPRRALRAARVIAKDPDDLPQVFTLVEALSMDTLERVRRRLQRTGNGKRMLASRPDIAERLMDRAALARLPEGTLGRAYLDFVEREHISAEGIREAGLRGMKEAPAPAPLDWVNQRLRDTHDLWHAATGYSGDVLGETALLAFTLTQTWNPAIALVVAIGWFKVGAASAGGAAARRTILDGFRRGLKSEWLPDQDWEALLALPVDEVRRRLSLEAPPVYEELRSSALKS